MCIAAAIVGGSVVGGVISAKGAKSAANAQVQAADRAAELQKQQFDAQMAAQEPFRQAGITNMNELQRRMGVAGDASSAGYGSLMKNFGDTNWQADPGYGFRLAEGQKALDRQAAARGGLISGAALKAAQGYGQNMASQEYQNAFNRYQTERGNIYNMLSGQQGVGQAATNAMGAAGQNYANQAGEAYMGAGNARASGYIGAANAYSGIANSLGNYGMMKGMGMFGGGGGKIGGGLSGPSFGIF